MDVGGVGGTLAGNALSMAAMRTALTEVLTEQAFRHTVPLAERFERGVQDAMGNQGHRGTLSGSAAGSSTASPLPPRNGGEAAASHDDELRRCCTCTRSTAGCL